MLVAGALPGTTLYQPNTSRNIAVPRLTTVKVRAQLGRNVSGVIAASLAGSRPARFDGMQVLSLNECESVVSHVAVFPSGHEPGAEHGAPATHEG